MQIASRIRDLALFNLAIDSKLHECDLMKLRFQDLTHGDQIPARAMVMQQKTQRRRRSPRQAWLVYTVRLQECIIYRTHLFAKDIVVRP